MEPLPELSSVLTTAPRVIGRFFIRGEIGRGSNGVVYAAHDPILDREVAIKAIPLSHDIAYRVQVEANFINEAKAAARLNHPNIVTVFDAGKSDHLAYIAMERLRGEDLHDVIARGERMGWRQVTHLMTRVADAVHFAHKRGLIHRDIKPSNIFLLRDGKPKVLDFGVAVMTMGPARGAHQRQLIGTPNYMSPEQARGERIDARTDVFSLGAILYELLSGVRAFDGNHIDSILAEVISGDPVPLNLLRPDLPQALVGVVTRALEKDPDVRYQTAGELRNQLAICAGRPSPTRLKSSNRPHADMRPRKRKSYTPRQLLASASRFAQTVSPRALAGISLGLFVFAVAVVLINKIAQPTDTPQPVPIQPQPAALDPIELDPIALVPTR
ncbi:MAG TPA: serine/threonine-protein kinase, partial [Burkholderiaceae bacterium]|nr:serine/threonine-protein kinase [Burkholderiaceae bacterium]